MNMRSWRVRLVEQDCCKLKLLSGPLGGLLRIPVPFSDHKIWWAIYTGQTANWKPITYGQSDRLPPPPPDFKTGSSALISPE
ncbi:hypothetical protein AVEN_168252-1 [Araneus ventricosus]|uniref:Uncharacterized protein n=1 Tax=Araneus ventricosus TaxID=182803 RepID=A0A4Y2VLD1_ARAVE|nr:hypothetical protein AVEN_168252-1 [Araneus ventricosus]